MAARIIQGNVFDTLPTIPAGSVNCCVTSPPYWALRSYLPQGHAFKHMELGSEASPAEFVSNMVRVFRLVRDCMADHATCWLNMGDTYNAYNANRGDSVGKLEGKRNAAHAKLSPGLTAPGLDSGNLCLIPQRLAISLQDDGWLVRSVICWAKPAPMPQSIQGWSWRRCRVKVKERTKDSEKSTGERYNDGYTRPDNLATWADCPGCPKCEPHAGYVLRRGNWRPTSSWEPILMLAKKQGYFCDGEAVKTPPAAATVSRDQYSRILDDSDEQFAVRHDHETLCDGANLRDVWRIASESLREKHYAAYPTKLVENCLRAGTSAKGYCPECGSPWARVIDSTDTGRTQKMADGWNTGPGAHGSIHPNGSQAGETGVPVMANKTIGWRQTCQCPPAEPRPGLVLDPFAGSGRTGIQANRMGLDFVGCELNPEYVEMARRLLHDASPLFSGAE